MRFHDEGMWHSIVVDDYIPCRVSGTTHVPSCARCRDPNECWVMLLEKVWVCPPLLIFSFFSPAIADHCFCFFLQRAPLCAVVAVLESKQYTAALLAPTFLQREVLLC